MMYREALNCPPPRKHSRLTRDIRAFSGFKFYLGDLYIRGILNLFQKFVIQKLGGNTESFKIHYGDGTATSSRNDKQSSCNTQCVGWSGTLSYNNRTNSCKTQVAGAAATLPLSLCEREQLLTSLRVFRDAGEGLNRG